MWRSIRFAQPTAGKGQTQRLRVRQPFVSCVGSCSAPQTSHRCAVPVLQAFDPPTITIKAGESVTWVNNAGFPHNVMFDEDDVPVRAEVWQDSRLTSHYVVWQPLRNVSGDGKYVETSACARVLDHDPDIQQCFTELGLDLFRESAH